MSEKARKARKKIQLGKHLDTNYVNISSVTLLAIKGVL